MFKDRAPIQSSLEFVTLDELVPKDHLVRKVESGIKGIRVIDSSFHDKPLIYDLHL